MSPSYSGQSKGTAVPWHHGPTRGLGSSRVAEWWQDEDIEWRPRDLSLRAWRHPAALRTKDGEGDVPESSPKATGEMGTQELKGHKTSN